MFFAGIYHSLQVFFVFPGLRKTNGTQEREKKQKPPPPHPNPTAVVITPYFLTRCSQMSLDNFSPQHAKKYPRYDTLGRKVTKKERRGNALQCSLQLSGTTSVDQQK